MKNMQYLISLILGAAGFWIFILNWMVFWQGYIKRKPAPSWIPFLSGCLICAAFLIFPSNPYRRLWWIAFIIDWGSLPGMGFSAWQILKRNNGRGE